LLFAVAFVHGTPIVVLQMEYDVRVGVYRKVSWLRV
jgi:hypothetical protein